MKKIDEEYYNKATKIMNNIEKYYIYKDELYDKVNEVEDGDSDKLLELIKPYVDSDPKEICGASTIIDIYMDKKMFNEAKPIAERIVSENPDYDYGKYELSLIYIELGEYDKALNVAKDLFYSNKESIYGYVCKSKAELKKGNNENGLIIAERACKLDPYNSFAATNLALAYHYNGMIEERDSMYQYCIESEFVEKDNYLKSIFSGEYKWEGGKYMIIPGFLISILTFPGVIVHEIAHQLFCRICGVAVLDVCYFKAGNPAGYVVHEIP